MKKLTALTAALVFGGAAFAFDLNEVKPGVYMTSAPDAAQTSPEAKPKNPTFRLANAKSPIVGTLEVTENHELVLKPVAGQKEGQIAVCVLFPKMTKIRISCSVKGEKFFAKAKGIPDNRFYIQARGANLFFRGGTEDVRYYDGGQEKPQYKVLQKVQNGEYIDIVMDIFCGEKPTYSVNDKKDIAMKGKCDVLKRLVLNVQFRNVSPETCLKIKNLKITEIQ